METLPLFPLSSALFPAGVMHLRIFEVRYLDMIRRCIAEDGTFGVVPLISGREVRMPESSETFASVGTRARIEKWEAPMPALLEIRCVGTTRFRLTSHEQGPYGLWMGEVIDMIDAPPQDIPESLQSAANALGKFIASLQQDGVSAAQMPIAPPFRLDEAGWVADRWSELLPLPSSEQERLLSMEDPVARLERIQTYLADGPASL
ncbi:MAG: LON peptidase substrate-binding domain-containing protein [Achromobacter sp.]|jgi:Lon protease-like protein